MDAQTERELIAIAERLEASDAESDLLTAGILYTLLGAARAGSLRALFASTNAFTMAEVGRLSN